MRTTTSAMERGVVWRVEWVPFLALLAAFGVGAAFLIGGFAGRSFSLYDLGNLITELLGWFILAWLLLYTIVERVLWRRTRNVGHRLQYLGAALLVLSPLFFWIPLLSGGWSALFSPAGMFGALLFFVSFVCGCVLALTGYYHRGFRAGEVDLYRNVVVREGERIDRITNAYSERPFTVHYDGLPEAERASVVQEWARTAAKAGLLLGHRVENLGTTVYPITWTGVGALRWGTALVHLLWLARSPERLTWVRIGIEGNVVVHISPYDYRRIRRPVAYHVLCAAVGDALVSSLLVYAGGDVPGSIAALTGAGASPPGRAPGAPTVTGDFVGRVAALLTTILVIMGLTSATVAAVSSPERNALAITNVRWSPLNPGPGETVDLFATLTGTTDFSISVDEFDALTFVYFNRTDFGFIQLRHIDGNDYGVRLGPFPEGTEATILLSAKVRRFSFGVSDILLTADPVVIRWGQVHRGGASGLSIANPTHVTNSTNITLGAWINSTATVDTAQVFVGYRYTSGSTSSGGGFLWTNLTPSGGRYEGSIPFPLPPPQPQGFVLDVYYRIVARDTTWNSATSELLRFEVIG